jgi:hypothetical protein
MDVLHGRRPRLVVGVVVLRREWFEPEFLRRESERDDESGRDKRRLHHVHIFVDLAERPSKTPEGLEAEQEAAKTRYEMETIRVSQRSMVGQNYQSGRGSRH